MSDDCKPRSVEEKLSVITDIAKSIPVYNDAIQPATQEIGKSLAIVAKTVNIALAPIKALVWGYDQIEEYLTKKIAEKLKDTPEENIVTPPTYIAGPAIEALRFAGYNEDLRELYANLLAGSMDKETTNKAHPGYVEIIRNITPAEARILKVFTEKESIPLINIQSKVEHGCIPLMQNYTSLNEYVEVDGVYILCGYITNLCRLGILEVPYGKRLADENLYEKLENSGDVKYMRELAKKKDGEIELERGVLRLTNFGRNFIDCVVRD